MTGDALGEYAGAGGRDAAPFESSADCPHCKGLLRHTSQQRCPMAPEPVVSGVFADDVRYFRPRPRAVGHVQASPLGFWRFVGVAFSTMVLLVCVPLYFNLVFDDLTSAYQEPGPLLVWIAATVAIGLVFGAGPMWWAARSYAKVVAVILSITFITTGAFMLVFAPVYRQINTPGIAEYRAANAMLLFGTLTTAVGLALAVLCVRWALDPEALRRLNRWRRPAGAAYGVLLGLLGLLVLSLMAVVITADDGEFSDSHVGVVAGVILFTALGMQFFVPGIILTFHGISSAMGERSSPFRAPAGALIALVFGAVLAVGSVNMRLEEPFAAPMPVLHTLAALAPGAAYIAFASRGSFLNGRMVQGLTWRQVTLAWGLAIGVGAMSAGFVNSIGGLWATILLMAQNGAFEDIRAISSGTSYDVFDALSDADYLLSSRQQWVANIIAIAVIPPVAEEFLKGLNVRFLMRRTSTRGQAFALGAAAGAGFGFVEALLYGAGVTADDLSEWWLIMVIRGGSTSLHCLNTGLVGVAWWYWSIAGRKGRAGGLYLMAVVFHALWNGFSVTLYSEIPWVGTLDDKTIERIVYFFVAGAGLALIAAIPLGARGLREPAPPPVETTPLGAMAPWVA